MSKARDFIKSVVSKRIDQRIKVIEDSNGPMPVDIEKSDISDWVEGIIQYLEKEENE